MSSVFFVTLQPQIGNTKKMKRITTGVLVALIALTATAQTKFSEPHGLYDVTSLTVSITPTDATAEVRYTTDGSEPTAIASVLNQTNDPEGYPSTWGRYTQFKGTAIADYEMDPEMTNDPMLRPKIIEGLKQLPILSVVSD